MRTQRAMAMPVSMTWLVLAGLLAGCAELGENWSPATIAETELRGNKIVAALQRHRSEYRFYPERLDALAPRYLPAIQAPTAGDRVWHYATLEGGSAFQLWVEGKAADNRGYLFDSATRRWMHLGPLPGNG